MKTELLFKNEVSAKIETKLSSEEFNTALDKIYNKNKEKYSIKGFRKGKAPRSVVEKNYGSDVFYDEAINTVASEAFGKFLDENKDVTPFTYPEVIVQKLGEEGLEFTIEIPFAPKVELGAYTGLNVKKEVYNVTAKEVEEELKKEQDKHARFEASKDPAKMGDIVNIDFKGFLKGKAFEGGEAQGFDLELGSHAFIPGFEEGLVGAKLGEERDVNVTFPKEYHAKNLAGKDVVFKCKVNDIKFKMLPVLNDEFAKEASEWNTLEEFKKSIKESLKKAKELAGKTKLEQDVVDAILEKSKFTISEIIIKEESNYMISDIAQRLASQGVSLEDYCTYTGTTIEDFRSNKKVEAEKVVKMRLVFKEIINKEKLEVNEDEIIARVIESIPSAHLNAESAKKYYDKTTPDKREAIKSDALMQKLLNFLVEKNVK